MIGKRFNKWIVIQQIKSEKPAKQYECICDCGNIRIKAGTELRAGRGKQCSECQYAELYNPAREVGISYGKWTVMEFVDMHRNMQRFRVRCECGFEKLYVVAELRAGKSTQCATCHNRENAKQNITHGMSYTKIIKVWNSMIQRCTNPNATHYYRYGGRGISVCDRWKKFDNFLQDMGIPDPGLTLDRINNDGDYEPTNCRWITHRENCNNRSKSSRNTRSTGNNQ